MERESLLQNKKGVSEMVGYVLLVVISVGLSVFVFAYLKLYVPKNALECEEEINIALDSAVLDCSENKLNISLSNQGLFSIDAAYVRFAPENRKIREWINDPKKVGDSKFYFPGKLSPGDISNMEFSLSGSLESDTAYIVEVQPANIVNEKLAACNNVVTQAVSCP